MDHRKEAPMTLQDRTACDDYATAVIGRDFAWDWAWFAMYEGRSYGSVNALALAMEAGAEQFVADVQGQTAEYMLGGDAEDKLCHSEEAVVGGWALALLSMVDWVALAERYADLLVTPR